MTNYAVIEKLQTEGLFLDANTRLRIDYAQTSLRDVLPNLEIAVFPYRQARYIDVTVDTFEENAELQKLTDLFDPELNNWEIYEAYLNANEFFTVEMDLAGYSQSEWANVIVYARDPISEETQKYIREIFRGENYYIFKEARTIYTAPDGRTIEEWETLEIAGDYTEAQVWEALFTYEDVLGALNFEALLGKKSMISPLTFVTISEEKPWCTADVTVQKMKEENGELVERCQETTYGADSLKIAEILFLNGRRDYLNAY